MAKIFGGSASRLEMYALFVAAVVLIGGGISGAVVLTSGGETSAPVTVVETSSTTTTAVPVEVTAPSTTAAPINQPSPPTSRYVDPPPVTVTPGQPVQDFSAYCVMPDVLGYFAPTIDNSGMEIQAPFRKLAEAGCIPAWNNSGAMVNVVSWCLEVEMPSNYIVRVLEQNPSAGTLVHKSFGRIDLRMAEAGRKYDLSRTDGHPPFC